MFEVGDFSPLSLPVLALSAHTDDELTDRRVSTVTALSIPNYLSQSTFQQRSWLILSHTPGRTRRRHVPRRLAESERPSRGICCGREGAAWSASVAEIFCSILRQRHDESMSSQLTARHRHAPPGHVPLGRFRVRETRSTGRAETGPLSRPAAPPHHVACMR